MSQRKLSSQMAGDWQVTSLKSKHQPRFQNKITPSTPAQEKSAQVVRGSGVGAVSPGLADGISMAPVTWGPGPKVPVLADGPMLTKPWGPGRLGKVNEVLGSQEILVG